MASAAPMLRTPSHLVTSTRVHESCVVPYAPSAVWGELRPLSFRFWDLVASSTLIDAADPRDPSVSFVGAVRELRFRDGSIWHIKVLEVSDIRRSVSYEVISADPPLNVMSAVHSMRVRSVTKTNHAFVEWVSDFSSDVTSEEVQDCRYKRLEAFDNLAGYMEARCAAGFTLSASPATTPVVSPGRPAAKPVAGLLTAE